MMFIVEEFVAGKWWLARSFNNQKEAEDFLRGFPKGKARIKVRGC
jgi:hypothetical protein